MHNIESNDEKVAIAKSREMATKKLIVLYVLQDMEM